MFSLDIGEYLLYSRNAIQNFSGKFENNGAKKQNFVCYLPLFSGTIEKAPAAARANPGAGGAGESVFKRSGSALSAAEGRARFTKGAAENDARAFGADQALHTGLSDDPPRGQSGGRGFGRKRLHDLALSAGSAAPVLSGRL